MSSGAIHQTDEQKEELTSTTTTTETKEQQNDASIDGKSQSEPDVAKDEETEATRDETPDLAVTKKNYTDKNTGIRIQFNNEESDIPTPNSTVDAKEDQEDEAEDDDGAKSVPPSEQSVEPSVTDPSADTPSKRKDSDAPEETPKPKRSRKLQGAGVKKPLYSRYESLYIVKAFKSISDKHPNLVLIDLFKIVAILFNEEANRQGFKERTPDQLYQKYKRIQHGLNHGETEFVDFFKQNKYNPREWIPDFSNAQNDEILKYIKFPKLEDAFNEVLGSSVANLKPPLPDLYDDDDDDDKNKINSTTHEITEEGEEEELLKLAGFEDQGNGTNPSSSSSSSSRSLILKEKIKSLEQTIALNEKELQMLKEGMSAKDQEIAFLKSMIKEDLSYIRHKLNEPQS